MSDHAKQNFLLLRKKLLLSGLTRESWDLDKYAADTDSHLSVEELEDSLKKAKGRHYSIQVLKLLLRYNGDPLSFQETAGHSKDP